MAQFFYLFLHDKNTTLQLIWDYDHLTTDHSLRCLCLFNQERHTSNSGNNTYIMGIEVDNGLRSIQTRDMILRTPGDNEHSGAKLQMALLIQVKRSRFQGHMISSSIQPTFLESCKKYNSLYLVRGSHRFNACSLRQIESKILVDI